MSQTLFIILAAGEGTRMRSSLPKVMHKIAGLPMVGHAIKTAQGAQTDAAFCVVIGPSADQVRAFAGSMVADATIVEQVDRLGTAHAVLQARDVIANGNYSKVVVLYGDTPLIKSQTLKNMMAALDDGASVTVLGFRPQDPTGYGRLLTQGDRLVAIREEKDATEAERAVNFCNSGVMAFEGSHALDLLTSIGNDNAKGEYYLTDAVEIAVSRGLTTKAVEADADEVLGVNTRVELAQAEALAQQRYRHEAMVSGVTLIDPHTVYFSHDTAIGNDTLVEPNVYFSTGVKVGTGASVKAYTHLEDTELGDNVSIGPFARMRGGCVIGKKAKIGNFVEMKKANFGDGAKASHLSYIGDANVGNAANIGAGTITCNYDGVNKHVTTIGANAFIGSNSALVAPVTIADNAYVGSGSVITDDVPEGKLAIARGRQVIKDKRS